MTLQTRSTIKKDLAKTENVKQKTELFDAFQYENVTLEQL